MPRTGLPFNQSQIKSNLISKKYEFGRMPLAPFQEQLAPRCQNHEWLEGPGIDSGLLQKIITLHFSKFIFNTTWCNFEIKLSWKRFKIASLKRNLESARTPEESHTFNGNLNWMVYSLLRFKHPKITFRFTSLDLTFAKRSGQGLFEYIRVFTLQFIENCANIELKRVELEKKNFETTSSQF